MKREEKKPPSEVSQEETVSLCQKTGQRTFWYKKTGSKIYLLEHLDFTSMAQVYLKQVLKYIVEIFNMTSNFLQLVLSKKKKRSFT